MKSILKLCYNVFALQISYLLLFVVVVVIVVVVVVVVVVVFKEWSSIFFVLFV